MNNNFSLLMRLLNEITEYDFHCLTFLLSWSVEKNNKSIIILIGIHIFNMPQRLLIVIC